MALWNKNTAVTATSTPNSISDAERMYREGMINQAMLLPERRIVASPSNVFGGYKPDYADLIESPRSRHHMLAMRLRITEGARMPFDDLHTSLGKEKVFVFIVQNDQAVTLEDDRNLFPSDTLVTQLRLIAK